MNRPQIKDFFPETTSVYEVIEIYKQSPELFTYAKALDQYIDQLEQSNKTLRETCQEMLTEWTPKNQYL